MLRASAMHPAIAEAATVAGLARCVRVFGPWRPSKLRLVVLIDAQVGEAVVADVAAEATRRLVPFEARLAKDAVESFGLGGALDRRRAWHADRLHAGLHFAPFQHRGRGAQVRKARIGARADIGDVDRQPASGVPGSSRM